MKKVGEIALVNGLIRPHQLQTALDEQKKNFKGMKLAEILIHLKYINDQQYQFLLEELDTIARKKALCQDWIHRYTDSPAQKFGKYIILTNFFDYLEIACKLYNLDPAQISERKMMPTLHITKDISLVCIRMGSPNMALALDIFSSISPKSVFFIGKCGGIKRTIKIGDYVIPSAAIRGEGTAQDYLPEAIPALPSFSLQGLFPKNILAEKAKYYTGVVHTTNRRLWEFDKNFCLNLIREKVIAVDMETATFFSVGFANNMSIAALLLISDLPLKEIKTKDKDKIVSKTHSGKHVEICVNSIEDLKKDPEQHKHFSYGYF